MALERDAKKRNADIELFLKKERDIWELQNAEPRILILGTSDSGKSTLIKQLKILHGNGFTKDE
ncbi:hypothetical protein HDU91_002638, partial [Kappamyces sp. JEL0680]